MRYLKSRDNYLKTINERRINKQVEKDFSLMLETYAMEGPFRNNLRWGDSWLGRIFHSAARKAIIAAKMVNIKFVVERLIQAFDELLITSTISELDDNDKKLWSRSVIGELLITIQESIEDYGKDNDITIDDIKSYVDYTISKVEEEENLENKNDLLKQLNELKDFLEPLEEPKEGDSDSDSDEEGEEGEEGKEGEEDEESESGKSSGFYVDSESLSSLYPVMVKNLKSLSMVLTTYKRFKPAPNTIKSSEDTTHDDFYTTKGGESIESIQKDVKINKNKLTSEQIWNLNKKVLEPYGEKSVKTKIDKYKIQLAKGLKIRLSALKEGFLFEEGPIKIGEGGDPSGIGTGAGKNRNVGTGGESHLTQAYAKIKKSCEILESPKEKGIGVTVDFLNKILEKSNSEEGMKSIKSLYKEILRYLIGDKKSTLNSSADPLFKESLEVISDKNKRVVVAEKIARFTMRAQQFDGQNLYGGLGEFGKPLGEFVETIKMLKKVSTSTSPKKEEKETKKTEEGLLLRYDGYLSLIKEADDSDDDDIKSFKKTMADKIQDYFEKKIDFSSWVLDKTEIQKVKTSIDKKMEESKNGLTIDGMDPVLDIVRCFNRAYKLHTTQVIPSNRTGGEVSNHIFREYTSFGGGSPATAGASGGPYRNNAIFNQWEDEVHKIMKRTEYQKIFNVGTRLKVGNDYIEKAGMNLRKFMNDLLDGDDLYKGGDGKEQGAQAKFLDKYFGYKDGDNPQSTHFGNESEASSEQSSNNENSSAIKPIKLKAVPEGIKYENPSDLEDTFFIISCSIDNVPNNLFCYIHSVSGDIANISYCRSAYHLSQYIKKSRLGQSVDLNGAEFRNSKKQDNKGQDFRIKATTLNISKFIQPNGKFTNSSRLFITSVVKSDKKDGDNKTVDNKSTTFQVSERQLLQSVRFLNVVDLEEGSNVDSYKRFKIKEAKPVYQFIKEQGGFTKEDWASIKSDLRKAKIENG